MKKFQKIKIFKNISIIIPNKTIRKVSKKAIQKILINKLTLKIIIFLPKNWILSPQTEI